MIKLIAKYIDISEYPNYEWYYDVLGEFYFYPGDSSSPNMPTLTLFNLLDESNMCDSDICCKNYIQKPGLKIIKKLGLDCQILVKNKYRNNLTKCLNALDIDYTDYFPSEYCTIGFNGGK